MINKNQDTIELGPKAYPRSRKRNQILKAILILAIVAIIKMLILHHQVLNGTNIRNPSSMAAASKVLMEQKFEDDVPELEAADEQKFEDDVPKLEARDIIYQPDKWGNPIVVEEYNLLFFTIPKVGCTQWKLLFRKMLGFPKWNPEVLLINLHNPGTSGLRYLTDFSTEEAQKMLTSDEWTRAVFVREPKERILSAFLDKFAKNRHLCDHCTGKLNTIEWEKCRKEGHAKNFTSFLSRAKKCSDPHWDPQADSIDQKWWPYMTFVGYMDNIASDSERLLKSIHSNITGESAWDAYGKTGWGKNGTTAFMSKNNAPHARNAHDKLREYFTTCTETFVEKHWQSEWTHDTYHFDTFRLFNSTNETDCDVITL